MSIIPLENFDDILYELEDSKKLLEIIKSNHEEGSPCFLEGNSFYHHLSYERCMERSNIRYNFWKLAKMGKNCLEVGFNAGHSSMLLFNSNPSIKVKAYDLCEHKYTIPCYEYLSSKYDLTLVPGNSLETTFGLDPKEKFDIIHIDGCHSREIAFKDIINCRPASHKDTLVVIDDTDFSQIIEIIGFMISCNALKEIDYESMGLLSQTTHRIFNFI